MIQTSALKRLMQNRMAVVCGGICVFITLFSFLGPLILAPWLNIDGITPNLDLGPVGPTMQHWLGTDVLGRDMLIRTMEGGQIALKVGVIATVVAIVIGVTWGATAAYVGGTIDSIMMRIVDVLYSFPVIVFIVVIQSLLQKQSIYILYALIGATSWLTMARIVRGQVLSLRNREFVTAAQTLGMSSTRIMFRHIIPNTMGIVIVYATLSLPGVMLTEAFLSFLGLGVQAPLASWGTLVTEGAVQLAIYPWTLFGPGIIMSTMIFCLNFFGDGLRDALDPRTKLR